MRLKENILETSMDVRKRAVACVRGIYFSSPLPLRMSSWGNTRNPGTKNAASKCSVLRTDVWSSSWEIVRNPGTKNAARRSVACCAPRCGRLRGEMQNPGTKDAARRSVACCVSICPPENLATAHGLNLFRTHLHHSVDLLGLRMAAVDPACEEVELGDDGCAAARAEIDQEPSQGCASAEDIVEEWKP